MQKGQMPMMQSNFYQHWKPKPPAFGRHSNVLGKCGLGMVQGAVDADMATELVTTIMNNIVGPLDLGCHAVMILDSTTSNIASAVGMI